MNKLSFSHTTHIFLWDLHDVILQKSLWNWFLLCIRFPRKLSLLKKLDKKSIFIMFTFLLERLKLTKKQMVSEELLKAAQAAGNDALIELTMKACSSYAPINKTISIMKELSYLGYDHHLGSNIGQTVFDDCMEKFSSIFSMFKKITIPFVCPKNNIIIKKPHLDFFYAHINKYNLQPEQVIFIDDKLANIYAAQSIGMHVIHFKNAKDLRKQLIQKKILSF